MTHTVRAELPRIERLKTIPTERASIMVQLLEAGNELEGRWKEGRKSPMHDPSTIAFLLAPHLFDVKSTTVSIETEDGERFGQTRLSETPGGPHDWVTAADADGFFDLMASLMERT